MLNRVNTARRWYLAVGVLALLTAVVARAADEGASSEQRYANWAVRCESDVPTAQRACYIYQPIYMAGSGEKVLDIAVGRRPGGTQHTVLITAPLGIYLPFGIELTIGDKPPKRYAVQRCNINGCHTEILLNDALLKALLSEPKLAVVFSDSTRQRFSVAVSTSGFRDAWRAVEPHK